MTMSWVAVVKPTITATSAISGRLVAGLMPEMASRPRMITAWQASIHARRWPSSPCSTGILVRSISGAHRNLNENDRVARLKKPITASDSPASRSHSDRVSKISM